MKEVKVVPYEDKYSSVFELMISKEYDHLFYNGDLTTYESRVKNMRLSLSDKYSGTGVVALVDDKAIGFAIAVTTKHSLVIAIDSEYTGNGLGKLMLDLVITKLHNAGINSIVATTALSNKRMQSVFNKIGLVTSKTPEGINYEINKTNGVDLKDHTKTLAGMSKPQ